MAGTTIGEVNINLRLSLAQFKKDTQEGTEAARTSTRKMAEDMKTSTREAKASLALLGEEMGVTIPRHVRGLIASLPGIGTALSMAFNSVALLAIVEVFVKLIEKIHQAQAEAEKLAEAHHKFTQELEDSARRLDKNNLGLGEFAGKLRQLGDELVKLAQEQATSTNGWTKFKDALGEIVQIPLLLVQPFRELIGELSKGDANSEKLAASAKAMGDRFNELAESGNVRDALKGVTAALNDLYGSADKGKPAVQTMIKDLEAMQRIFSSKVTEAFTEDTKKNAEALKKQQEEARRLLEALVEVEKQVAKMPLIARGGPSLLGAYAKGAKGDEGLFGVGATLEKIPLPGKDDVAYGGTKEADELYKVQTNQTEAIKRAQEVYTQTRTAAEQYRAELAVLDSLLKQGRIDQDTYNRAVDAAQEKMTHTKQAFADLGRSIGETIEQGLLFGRSWTDSLKSIIVQVAELIVKLTIIDKMKLGGGGGGFFGSLLGGLFGGTRDSGGSGTAGVTYFVGTPELFTPSVDGTFIPMDKLQGGGTRVEIHNHIDARGSSITREQFEASMKKVHQQAVADAVSVTTDRSRRKI